MKWKEKGREYDSLARQLTDNFQSRGKKVYVFGAGIKGEYVYKLLSWYGIFASFIDNSEEKRKSGKCSEKVISLDDYKENFNDGIIVVAVKYGQDICNQLKANGFLENTDYYLYDYFMKTVFPIISLYEYNLLYSEMMQICLTERCTLKCKYCAHGCYNVKPDSADPTEFEIIESIKLFFSKVDKVLDFVLLGGEPFLYKDIGKIVGFIGENYRKNLLNFAITTNGTIIPSDEILEVCKKYDVSIRISNYSANNKKLVNRYSLLCEKLEKFGVKYTVRKDEAWKDYGFRSLNRKADINELIGIFDSCPTPCRELRNGKIYYCVQARSTGENLNFGVGKEDCLDLNYEEDKKVILEYLAGYSSKGYLDMCDYCYGAEAEQHSIPVAEQL